MGKNVIVYHNDYITVDHPRQTNPHLQTIIDQAAAQMGHDYARWGNHSRIWLSCVFAKNGWPWPPSERET